ncbi:MAG: cyclic nucleotide-binding domain-containing protein, partial [Proteobacteria bacterium]|nr:cyclic nucleotide-binding domain-containing protein [Pseudomonadota bacterium]
AQTATYLPGDTIIGQHERGDAFYIITHGDVSVFRSSGGEEVQIGELGTGDFIGETSLLYYQARSHERSATLKARTPITLLRIRHQDILKLMKKHPEIRRRMQDVHSARTRPTRYRR